MTKNGQIIYWMRLRSCTVKTFWNNVEHCTSPNYHQIHSQAMSTTRKILSSKSNQTPRYRSQATSRALVSTTLTRSLQSCTMRSIRWVQNHKSLCWGSHGTSTGLMNHGDGFRVRLRKWPKVNLMSVTTISGKHTCLEVSQNTSGLLLSLVTTRTTKPPA